jgi:hypothetical protein
MRYIGCIKKGIRVMGIGLRKATSYKVVKSRLNYRWYNDEYLQAKLKYNRRDIQSVIDE